MVDVVPEGGTLVTFWSAELDHAVLPALRDCRTITAGSVPASRERWRWRRAARAGLTRSASAGSRRLDRLAPSELGAMGCATRHHALRSRHKELTDDGTTYCSKVRDPRRRDPVAQASDGARGPGVAQRTPSLGIATVYRQLKRLVGKQQIVAVELPGEPALRARPRPPSPLPVRGLRSGVRRPAATRTSSTASRRASGATPRGRALRRLQGLRVDVARLSDDGRAPRRR